MEERITNALENARLAFWAEVAKSFPETDTGDFPPDAQLAFDEATDRAVRSWVRWNVPEADNA
jgi:hypothetical protein